MALGRFVIFLLFFLYLSPAKAEFLNSSLLPKAEAGDVCAQTSVGKSYASSNKQVDQNLREAVKWLLRASKAACNGDSACINCQDMSHLALASVYETKMSPPNKKEAFKWYKKSAELGIESAFEKVSEYYLDGEVTKQDFAQAYFWITPGVGRNKNKAHLDLMAKIKPHLSAEKMKTIDSQKQDFLKRLAERQRERLVETIDKMAEGFKPDLPSAYKANARLFFEININQNHYDLLGIKKLIDRGALKSGTHSSSSFLFVAQNNDDLDLLKLLIDNGADINGADERGYTVLHRAIGHGHTDIALALIAAGASLEDRNDLGKTPLIAAAQKGDLEIVKALVEAGANVNYSIVTGAGRTKSALSEAMFFKQSHIVSYLESVGAELTEDQNRYIRDSFGTVPKVDSGKKCSTDTKRCPNNARAQRKGDNCQFEECPAPKVVEERKYIKGTFSEIETARNSEAVFILNDGSLEDKEKVISDIQAQPGNYNPAALKALSRAMFSQILDTEGAFWFVVADLRNRQDNLICETNKAAWKTISFDFLVPHFKHYARYNPEAMEVLLAKALEWDRTTPYNYDVRWVALGGGMSGYKPSDLIPEKLCIDENKKDEAREYIRNEYSSVFRVYTQKHDYKDNTVRSNVLNADAFKELLVEAQAGNMEAQYKIATVRLSNEHREFIDGDSKAFRNKWLVAAAEQGHVGAMSILGSNYLSGYGVLKEDHERKIEEGKLLLIEAGRKGSLTAYEALGGQYLSRENNPVEAYAWYALSVYVHSKNNPALRMFPAKKKKLKLEATLSESDLKAAKQMAQEYINNYESDN